VQKLLCLSGRFICSLRRFKQRREGYFSTRIRWYANRNKKGGLERYLRARNLESCLPEGSGAKVGT